MRRLAVVLVLIPALAHAELSQTERVVLAAGVGGVVLTYAAVSTVFMMDQLLRDGFAEPKWSVPAGFLAGGSLVASVAGLVVWARAGDEIGIVGGAMAALSSAVMCFFVTLAIHGWSIRQPSVE